MELKLQLSVFVLLIQVSLAVWRRVTVKKGHTLSLSCPITDAHMTHIEWKNPEGYIMFFNRKKALLDKRYSINKLSQTEFTISISKITFKDGGNYTCSQYGTNTTEKKVEVTILGRPKMEVAQHEGRFVIKCSAEGNHYPPQISWKLDNLPEILAHVEEEVRSDKGRTYVSMALLHVDSVKRRTTVKCLVRHPALHSKPLMNFVKIGPHSTKYRHTTTGVPGTTTSWVRQGRTTGHLATRGIPSGPPLIPATLTDSPLTTSDESTISMTSGLTRRWNDTFGEPTTDWTSVSGTTDTPITSDNSTDGNRTISINDPKMRTGPEGSSSLLVFLVTCLLFGLLVVVIFFAIKLRRAHTAWKRENEDTDPSEESSKSKSSQEERNVQGQRQRGLFTTAFTQYVIEKPTLISSVMKRNSMAATESVNPEQHQPQTPGQTLAKSDIKETEL
ncbi:cytotoxic and regulatory T-cell molecule [Pungitius pungitius]|uniref:cytotoxic and regulatory T-cell molecule n=1 Tax=Pungitius pungitius TaxID=134920 RepID=UPI0018894B12|nr:cytotoxic and regulatory T-cell molecule [Pungitius pungitius]